MEGDAPTATMTTAALDVPAPRISRLQLLDTSGKPRPEEWEHVQRAVGHVKTFFNALRRRFIYRASAINKLEYAFVIREHALLFGPFGTAKTELVRCIFDNLEGAVCWQSDLAKSMSDTQVFGDFDIQLAQATGQLMHRIPGSLLAAEFANLGEFLDANTPLQRSLLRVLLEREFRRGSQHLDLPLMTAIANTNVSPHEAMMRDGMISAVVDRFLFWEQVGYVAAPEDRMTLLLQEAEIVPRQPMPKLSKEDVVLVADAIKQLPMLCSRDIVTAYETLTRKFAEARKRPISDRRLIKGIRFLKAVCLMRGSFNVEWEDLDKLSLVLVDKEDDRPIFQALLEEVRTHGQDADARSLVEQEMEILANLMTPSLIIDPDTITNDEALVQALRELKRIRPVIQSFAPQTPAAQTQRLANIRELDAKIEVARAKIEGGS